MYPISYRYASTVIEHSVWLYLRFTLSYRDVEGAAAERGPDISYKAFAVGCSNSDWRLLGLCGDAVLNGMQTARRLKANEQTRAIPIVAVTAFRMSGDRGIILGGGCDDYMAKPVELTRFLKLVDRYPGQND